MPTISGEEFKAKYPGPYLKWIQKNMDDPYDNFTYSFGRNIFHFEPRRYDLGGLRFMMDIKYLPDFYFSSSIPILGIFDITDCAEVYFEHEYVYEFRCDRVVLLDTVTSDVNLVEYFEKAKENGCDLKSSWTCAHAAKNGHLEILKWLKENGCPWDSDTCAYAAQNGHLEVLKWAKENGCPWDSQTCAFAAQYGHLGVVEWIWNYISERRAETGGQIEVSK